MNPLLSVSTEATRTNEMNEQEQLSSSPWREREPIPTDNEDTEEEPVQERTKEEMASASRSGSTDRKKTENRTEQDRNGPDHRSWSLIFENERPQKTGLNEPVRTGSNRYFVVLIKTFKISPRMY
jgi:hypothetical protein